jgi:DNA-binding GntR family transcriptional regulator
VEATSTTRRRSSRRPAAGGSRGAEIAAVAAITQRIRDGRYAQGQRLSESFLAQDLSLGRNTVREALRSAATSGLVTLEPNKGARVVCLDRQDISGMLQLREVIEGLAASLSAANINLNRNRLALTALTNQIRTLKSLPASKAAERFFDHNESFHNTLVEVAGNQYLDSALAKLNVPALRPAYFRSMDEDTLRASLQEHEDIGFAILEGDALEAERLMRGHVKRTHGSIVRLSDDVFFKIYRS